MARNTDPVLPGFADFMPAEPKPRQEVFCPFHGPMEGVVGAHCGRHRRVTLIDDRGYIRSPIPAHFDDEQFEQFESSAHGVRALQEEHLPLDFARCSLTLRPERSELWSRVWPDAVAPHWRN